MIKITNTGSGEIQFGKIGVTLNPGANAEIDQKDWAVIEKDETLAFLISIGIVQVEAKASKADTAK